MPSEKLGDWRSRLSQDEWEEGMWWNGGGRGQRRGLTHGPDRAKQLVDCAHHQFIVFELSTIIQYDILSMKYNGTELDFLQ